MRNDGRWNGVWESLWSDVEGGMLRFTGIALVCYALGVADRDVATLNLAWVVWFGLYLLVAPFIVIRVGKRTPPGDRWRAAACLAYGGTPAPLFLLPHEPAFPFLVVAIPVAIAWGIVAWLKAVRDAPPPRPPRVRAVVMAGAGVLCGLVSLPLFAGAFVGFVMGVWAPPPVVFLAATVIVGACLPLAVFAAYASAKLFGEAARAWRLAAEPGAP